MLACFVRRTARILRTDTRQFTSPKSPLLPLPGARGPGEEGRGQQQNIEEEGVSRGRKGRKRGSSEESSFFREISVKKSGEMKPGRGEGGRELKIGRKGRGRGRRHAPLRMEDRKEGRKEHIAYLIKSLCQKIASAFPPSLPFLLTR